MNKLPNGEKVRFKPAGYGRVYVDNTPPILD